MRKFLCVALTLAMLCATAALAETMEEYCRGYEAYLPVLFQALELDEETTERLTQVFTLSYDADWSEQVGFPTYKTEADLLFVSLLDEDDFFEGFSVGVLSDEESMVTLCVKVFLGYFAIRIDTSDSVSELLDRVMANSGQGEAGMFGNYAVSYIHDDAYTILTFGRR